MTGDERERVGEAVVVYPGGSSTAARFAMVAAGEGYDNLVIRNSDELPETPALSTIREHFEIDLIEGIELDPDEPDDASGRLPHLREQYDLVSVCGGNESLNRFIAQQRHVDVLARPLSHGGGYLDVGIAKQAKANDVAIELDLGGLRDRGGSRVRFLSRLQRLWEVIDHYDIPYVVSMRPTSHLELTGVREVRALGAVIGIDESAIQRGLGRWATLAESDAT